jgi:hypothetical protein
MGKRKQKFTKAEEGVPVWVRRSADYADDTDEHETKRIDDRAIAIQSFFFSSVLSA